MRTLRGTVRVVCACLTGLLLVLLGTIMPVRAAPVVLPALNEHVMDLSATLDAGQRSALAERLTALSQQTGAQIAVLMLPSTGEEDIESFAVRAFESWKLGREGVDDGVLIIVAKDDRAMRLEVGYGLEGVITDARASRIIREQMAPAFGQGDFAGGLNAALDSLASLILQGGLPEPSAPPAEGSTSVLGILAVIVLVLLTMLRAVPWPFAMVLVYVWSQSIVWAVLVGLVLFVLNRVLHRPSTQVIRRHGANFRRRGWPMGGGGGGSRSGGGFRNSGGFRGGGGRSGGGGASGRW